MASTFREEVKEGKRFEFGKNWSSFLKGLNDTKISNSQESLLNFIDEKDFEGKSFLDVGSGSGLSSLVARKSGAKVLSFDYDDQSVECTRFLRNKYYKDDPNWDVQEGSALDGGYMRSLGKFDIVYSWGVLHHTGAMYDALELIDGNVKANGKLFLALYNDQGYMSKVWKFIKRSYVRSPYLLKKLILGVCYIRLWGPTTVKDFLKLRPFHTWRTYGGARGMSPHWDVIDWVGGYPFEVSKPEEITQFFSEKNYELVNLKTCGKGIGCNEYVFRKREHINS